MADNYLEKKYQEFLEKKARREKSKKLALRKKLEEYKKRMEKKS